MSKLPETQTSLSRFLRQQRRVVTRLANSTPYALSGTSVVGPGLTTVDERLVAGTPGGSRVELDSAGLRKYAADGTTVQVDLTGEVAAFSGLITGSEVVGSEIKTASSGARVELDPGEAGGAVNFYTGNANEWSPGKINVESVSPTQGYLQISSPYFVDQHAGYIYLWTGSRSNIGIEAGHVWINPVESEDNYTQIGGATLYTNISTLEKTWSSNFLMRRIMVVADATQRAALVTAYTAAPRSQVIDSTHPLFIWQADEAAGAQLQYTVNGTTFVTIGGGGGTALFADPNADRLVFWDDSAGAFAPLTASTGLTLTGTDLTVRAATDALMGGVELATPAETITGLDDQRATTPAGVKAAIDATVLPASGGTVLTDRITTDQAIAAATFTPIQWNARTETTAMNPTTNSGTRLVALVGGLYTIDTTVIFKNLGAGASETRAIRFSATRASATTTHRGYSGPANPAANFTEINAHLDIRLAAGDYVVVEAWASIALTIIANQGTRAAMAYRSA